MRTMRTLAFAFLINIMVTNSVVYPDEPIEVQSDSGVASILTSKAAPDIKVVDRVEILSDGTLRVFVRLSSGLSKQVEKSPDFLAKELQQNLSVFFVRAADGTDLSHGDRGSGAPSSWLTFSRHLGIDSSRPYDYEWEKKWFSYRFVRGDGGKHQFVIPLKSWLAHEGSARGALRLRYYTQSSACARLREIRECVDQVTDRSDHAK